MTNEQLLHIVRTPHKAEHLVLSASYREGAFDSHLVDCPFLFRHDGSFGMLYIGWDGSGYQTGLARSNDLLRWEKLGVVIGRGPKGSATEVNVAMSSLLRDNDLFGPSTLKRVDGKFVGAYHAQPKPGYEIGPGVIGLCFSEDLMNWEVGDPILTPDPDCRWEAGGLYKAWIMENEGTYYLFYNAKDKSNRRSDRPAATDPWQEETGVATSRDLVSWERYEGNPVLRVGAKGDFDDGFASDPCVLHHEGTWVMFYFGNCTDGHARDGVAFSRDLLHWEKGNEVMLNVGSEGSIDSIHAHKPGIISEDGILYHFYCAVAPAPGGRIGEITHNEARGISFASNCEMNSALRRGANP